MSTTPRTDEAAYYHGLGGTVGVNFARTLETELAASKAECAEKQATFDLMFSANLRGIKMWQDAHPEHSETWPDLAKLVAWLLSELAAATKRIADCEFLLAHRYKIIERQEPRCNEAIARAERAEAECLEQARLLGKSGEREADLLGKLERLNRVIERASVQFFHEGTDGETAAKMLTVLNEIK